MSITMKMFNDITNQSDQHNDVESEGEEKKRGKRKEESVH